MQSMPLKCAVSNTGPMLSIFQSGQVALLKALYDCIYIPASELPEYEKHGAGALIRELVASGFVVVCDLTEAEKEAARQLAAEIAHHPLTKDGEPQSHYPEAEALVLVGRTELSTSEILLDELAAREVAKAHGLSIIGFAGLLIRLCRRGSITPEEVRDIMFACQSLGTHYATHFIEDIYEWLQGEME